jgi:hypothetical protein
MFFCVSTLLDSSKWFWIFSIFPFFSFWVSMWNWQDSHHGTKMISYGFLNPL